MAESLGSFYVIKSKSTKTGWRLLREFYVEGRREQRSVPKTAWAALGFTDVMTLEQARARAKQLNGEQTVKRREMVATAKIAHRIEQDRLHHSTFVPADRNDQFIKWLDANIAGNDKHKDKIHIQWTTAKKIIIALQLPTEDYAANKVRFYRYFASQEYSLDYVKKLLRMINLYGKFCARLTGKFFEEIPAPKGQNREMINDAYMDSDGYFGPSDPLTPTALEETRSSLADTQYKWLYCTVWLGLRPSELDMICADRKMKAWRLEEGIKKGDPDILWVYQPKLTSKPRDMRWKPIPLLFKEQVRAKEFILGGGLVKPIQKTMRKHFEGHVTLYGGRKGFTDLMLDRDQRLEDIAQWLGHSSIEMTWKRYKDNQKVHFPKPRAGS